MNRKNPPKGTQQAHQQAGLPQARPALFGDPILFVHAQLPV